MASSIEVLRAPAATTACTVGLIRGTTTGFVHGKAQLSPVQVAADPIAGICTLRPSPSESDVPGYVAVSQSGSAVTVCRGGGDEASSVRSCGILVRPMSEVTAVAAEGSTSVAFAASSTAFSEQSLHSYDLEVEAATTLYRRRTDRKFRYVAAGGHRGAAIAVDTDGVAWRFDPRSPPENQGAACRVVLPRRTAVGDLQSRITCVSSMVGEDALMAVGTSEGLVYTVTTGSSSGGGGVTEVVCLVEDGVSAEHAPLVALGYDGNCDALWCLTSDTLRRVPVSPPPGAAGAYYEAAIPLDVGIDRPVLAFGAVDANTEEDARSRLRVVLAP